MTSCPDSAKTLVLAVVGPTAVGKTALAEELALRFGGEIVSADSMQIYSGMDIGTAKPAPGERRVPYHCIDLVDPGEPFSAALFQDVSRTAIQAIARRDALPVVAGGTGLYIRAALDRMEFPRGELADNPARQRYERIAGEDGPEALHALLFERDRASADLIHPNNVRRVVRALEMNDEGVSYADQVAGFSARQSFYDTRYIGLTMDREALYGRIDARVDAMMDAGLLGEVERLLSAGLRNALTANQAIGYKEFVPVIEDAADLDDAISAVKQASRRYAKRQLTWFRSDPRIPWIDVTALTPEEAVEAATDTLDLCARWSRRSDRPAPQP
jgi:tRNA dimethylallyltransferase